jgi:hypothetical protein
MGTDTAINSLLQKVNVNLSHEYKLLISFMLSMQMQSHFVSIQVRYNGLNFLPLETNHSTFISV